MTVKIPQKPELLLPPGVTRLEPKKASVDSITPKWADAVACLKELIVHLETERLPVPCMIYIAMQAHHPEDDTKSMYPSYSWSESKVDQTLRFRGLLDRHKAAMP